MATTQTVGQLIAEGLIRRFKRDDGAWLVSFAAPTGPRIYNSLYRHPDSTAGSEEESLIVLQNARKSVEWAIDHFLAGRSDECPMCGKKAIELAETVEFSSPADEKLALELVAKRTQALQARIAELEQALEDARTALRRGNYSALKEALERVGKSATECRTCGGNGEICISAGDAIWGEPCPTCGCKERGKG